jgi:cyclic-di-AMP phosphodiesterase PgpH
MVQKQTLFDKLKASSKPDYEKEIKGIRYSGFFKIIILVATLIACSFFFTFTISQSDLAKLYNVDVGSIWSGESMVADFSFPIFKKNKDYEKEKDEAREKALQVFIYNSSAQDRALLNLKNIVTNFEISPNILNTYLHQVFSEKSLDILYNIDSNKRITEIKKISQIMERFIRNIYVLGYADRSIDFILQPEISVRVPPNTQKIYSKFNVLDSNAVLEKAKEFFANRINNEYYPFALEMVSVVIQPNIRFSSELTKQSQELAEMQVAQTDGIVRKGEVIINKGDKVTRDIFRKIVSYQRSRNMQSDTGYNSWIYLGSLIHSFVLLSILIIYLFLIRRRIFHDNYQIMVICLILVFVALLTWLSLEARSSLPLEYLIIVPSLAMLTAIIFDSRTAFYVTVTMSLLLAGIRGNDYNTGTTMLFAGTLAAYTVRDIQSRTQIFQSIFFIFIGLAVPIIAFSLEKSSDISNILDKLGVSLINSAFSPLITFGLLFLLERISNVTTDLKLQEYNNLNHPLLIKMGELAPGSYQHTLSLAVLSEKCAASIGANQLLAKVGAYFHDIGKIAKAEYFVENQIDIENKHDALSPKKSAEVIRKHVADGIRLAKENNLPMRIIDFIPMHHGTSLIKYFYAKALEQANQEDINEMDYRYPGPKPRNKETAIVMICDSVEAISRLASKDRDRMEETIDGIIRDKLLDGQFDECNLTFKDLQIIKETCMKSLIGISHQRVEYKEIPEKK